MPITKQSTVSHVLIGLHIDMLSGEGRAVVRRYVDGEEAGDREFLVGGAQFAALLQKDSLGDKVTDAVYAYLASSGLVEGTIS